MEMLPNPKWSRGDYGVIIANPTPVRFRPNVTENHIPHLVRTLVCTKCGTNPCKCTVDGICISDMAMVTVKTYPPTKDYVVTVTDETPSKIRVPWYVLLWDWISQVIFPPVSAYPSEDEFVPPITR